MRLDAFLARQLGCSRTEARRLIESDAVRVDGRRARKGLCLEAAARVEVSAAPPSAEELRPIAEPERPLAVSFADEALVAIAKPAGEPTHPLRAGERGTAANALVARYPECAGASEDPREGGAAHRLDVDTSGVLIFARTPDDWRALRRAFAGGRAEKEYWALVRGAPADQGEIRAALAHSGTRKMRALDEAAARGARDATTRYQVLARGQDVALVRALTTTGRMHQVRAHLAHAGFPLVGDALYGGAGTKGAEGGHVLHAARLTLPHPRTGAALTLTAPLPLPRAELIERLTGWRPPG